MNAKLLTDDWVLLICCAFTHFTTHCYSALANTAQMYVAMGCEAVKIGLHGAQSAQ